MCKTQIYIKERAYGTSSTVNGRTISSFSSTAHSYSSFKELKEILVNITSTSAILKMLSTQPNLKYEISIITQ